LRCVSFFSAFTLGDLLVASVCCIFSPPDVH
jgi:hypothetical protein